MSPIALIPASSQDVPSIARLHAQSWRATYRGVLPDEFLDHRVESERLEFWTARFANFAPDRTVVLQAVGNGTLLGFVAYGSMKSPSGARGWITCTSETASRSFAQQPSVPELRYWWAPLPL